MHKPFEKMTKEEIVNFAKKGKNYYKKILNPQTTENEEIGEIHFPNARAMESDYKYMEQYPFVRKNIKNAKENIFLKPKTKQDKKQHLDAEGFNNLKVKWKGKEYDYQIRKNSNDGNNDFYNIKPYEYLEKDIQELLLKILSGN